MNPLSLFSDTTDAMLCRAGDAIFREGESGGILYIVRDGEVEISVDGKTLETIGKGGIIGELSLIDRQARSATATAKSPAELIPVDEARFRQLVSENPFFALHVMDVMAKRLRKTTKGTTRDAVWSAGIGSFAISIQRR